MGSKYLTTGRIYAAGFSLIELMVVISIMTLLTSLALPNVAILKIRAARVELAQNTHTLFTLAESYQAENGTYPLAAFTYGVTNFGVYSLECNQNALGFATTNCDKLRYFYIYNNGTTRTFTFDAWSFYWRDPGGEGESAGNGPVTTWCKVSSPTTYSAYYSDWWIMNQTGNLQPSGGLVSNDMLKSCFN